MLSDSQRKKLIEWSANPTRPLKELYDELKKSEPHAFLKGTDLHKRNFVHKPKTHGMKFHSYLFETIEEPEELDK